METPCPPYYAEPTHAATLLFSTSSYVRRYNDWYQCIEGAYCNAPSFLGYNPPGEGNLWDQAWIKLDGGYPCNPALETSSSGRAPAGGSTNSNGGPSNNNNDGGFRLTARPTSKPTRIEETPSLISGQVWYDSNGDGLKNKLNGALTWTEYDAATKERGAGLSNMKITLRDCSTDKLVGVTYSFPRSFGFGGEGDIEVIDASYIEAIEAQEQESSLYSVAANDGLGIGNTEGTLGYYSFNIMPFQLPGEFYVVFESAEGYRLTGGNGEYWEVYEAALFDDVQPLMEVPWLEGINTANRRQLQDNDEASEPENGNPSIGSPEGPIKHSGYFARSNCFSIRKSPTKITNVDAGFTEDSWPLIPYQYASLVVTITFYSTSTRARKRRGRKLQLNDSLECRKYQKLKSEGVEVEDIWGCETGTAGGAGLIIDYKELTMDEGDLVVMSLKDFLESRVSRVWTVKMVSLAHKKMIVLDGDSRRLGQNRHLQGNKEVAQLELGFRIRAEYSSDRRGEDLSDVIMGLIRNGPDSFLIGLKGIPTGAGGVEVRDILWQPEEEKVSKDDDKSKNDAVGSVDQETPPSQEEIANDNAMPMELLIGIIVGCIALVAIVIFILIICKRRKKSGRDSVSEDASSRNKASRGNTWWQRKQKQNQKQTKKKPVKEAVPVVKKRAIDESEESSDYDDSYDDDDDDDLSSRFFSDSSKYDPEARAKEVGGYGDEGLEDYDDDLSSRFYQSDASSRNSEVGSYASGSQSYSASSRGGDSEDLRASYASAYLQQNQRSSHRSSATSGRKSRSSKNNSMRSSASTNQSSLRSSATTNQSSTRSSARSAGTSLRSSGMASTRASDLYSSSGRSGDSSYDDSMSRGSQSTRDRPRRKTRSRRIS